MRFTKPYRGRRPTKRLDLTDLRELLRDRRQWCAIGKVVVPPGEASHVSMTDSDIMIEVVLQPSLLDVTCRLSAGIWLVPAVGEEVVVVMPEGQMEFMPTVIGILSSGVVPTAQQPSATRIALVRQEVVVHDGAGGANPLPTLVELQNLITLFNQNRAIFNSHAHLANGQPPVQQQGAATNPTGTTVLKAK